LIFFEDVKLFLTNAKKYKKKLCRTEVDKFSKMKRKTILKFEEFLDENNVAYYIKFK
jgi:hypothetical protein